MEILNATEAAIHSAHAARNTIILVTKEGKEMFEGRIERIYDGHVIKFATRSYDTRARFTGFLLISDVAEIIAWAEFPEQIRGASRLVNSGISSSIQNH